MNYNQSAQLASALVMASRGISSTRYSMAIGGTSRIHLQEPVSLAVIRRCFMHVVAHSHKLPRNIRHHPGFDY